MQERDLLKHIRFSDARKMKEVSDGSAQLVYLSPPYVGHHSKTEKENERILLTGLLNEAVRVSDPKFGFVVTYNTDFYLKGGTYARHDVVRETAEAAGLELYAQKYHVSKIGIDTFRMGIHHIQVFIHQGTMETAKKRNRKIREYQPDVWYFAKKQKVGDFRDAIPPETVVIPIANFTEKGELVVSQCAGTGTIVIAALRMGRDSVGYEIDKSRKELIKIRNKRFEDFFYDKKILELMR
jgi:tRNA G10  N-methylase Trm11